MELTKENYLKWFDHEDDEIAVAAFQSAFKANLVGDPMFDFAELCLYNPSLTQSGIDAVFKNFWKSPLCEEDVKISQQLAEKFASCSYVPFVAVKKVLEYYVVGCFSETLQQDYFKKFFNDYEPTDTDAGEYLLSSQFYSFLDDCDNLKKVAVKVVVDDAYEVKLAEFLAGEEFSYLYQSDCSQKERDILDVMITLISKVRVEKQPGLWLYLRCFDGVFAEVFCDFLQKNPDRLDDFMSLIISLVKHGIGMCGRDALIKTSLRLLNNGAKISINHSTNFFEQLDKWLSCSDVQAIALLDDFLKKHPGEGLKVFKLYDRMIVTCCNKSGKLRISSMEWMTNDVHKLLSGEVAFWIDKAFKPVFAMAVKRHGSKEDQFRYFNLLLLACGSPNDSIAEQALSMLKSFDALTYLTGDVCLCLSSLDEMLLHVSQKNKSRVKSHVNSFIDLSFARLYHEVLDVKALDDFCLKHMLRAKNFYQNYQYEVLKARERFGEKQEILKVLNG